MFYQCKYFKIYELVDKPTFDQWGDRAWQFFNPLLLMSLDALREFYGVGITVNNWYWEGRFSQRGLRNPSSTVGATFSQHRLGNAIDCDVKGIDPKKVREDIVLYKDTLFPYINCLEGNINWVHFDCRNIENRIMWVYP